MTLLSLTWRGQVLDFDYDRSATTVGVLGAQISERTGIPLDRITVMVPGWKLKKFNSPDIPLADCTSTAAACKGTLIGTPQGQEFVPKERSEDSAARAALALSATPAIEHGYVNLGNTCYMNSILAMLEACDEFVMAVKSGRLTGSTPLGAAWQQLWTMKQADKPGDPRRFFQTLCAIYPNFGQRSTTNSLVNQQQDADECLTVLFNNVASDPAWKDLFQFTLSQRLEPVMGEESGAREVAPIHKEDQSLKLSCYPGTSQQPVSNITAGLSLGFKDTLELNNVSHTRTSEITKSLPKYMIVHIVRFEWKKANDLARTRACRAKVLKRIEYPEILDIYQFCDAELKEVLAVGRAADDELPAADGPREEAAKADADFDERVADGSYRLRAVVTHRGRTVEEGHYICWRWHAEEKEWVKLDDDKSSRVLGTNVDLQGGIADGHVPYLLLYERRGQFIA